MAGKLTRVHFPLRFAEISCANRRRRESAGVRLPFQMLGWLPKQTIAVTMTVFRRLFFCCLLLPAIAIAQCRTAAA